MSCSNARQYWSRIVQMIQTRTSNSSLHWSSKELIPYTIPLKLSKEYFNCRPLPGLLVRRINLVMWDNIVCCNLGLRWRWFMDAIVNKIYLNSTGISRFTYALHHLLHSIKNAGKTRTVLCSMFYDVASNAPYFNKNLMERRFWLEFNAIFISKFNQL